MAKGDSVLDNLKLIQSSIDYIEENLKTELNADELASNAGFSLFHYYHIFQSVVGMPVMQYVLKRRLQNAIYEIYCGKKIIDASLEYSFQTHAGFFKAFKREYDCSPSQYLRKYVIKKPYKINLRQEKPIMITHSKIKEILTNWDIKEVKITDYYFESRGVKSDSIWYIGEDYVLKAQSNLTALKQHILISNALAKAGLEAATPIKAKNDTDYIMDGDFYFCLTKRIQGECILSGESYKDGFETKARYIGEIIGQLQLILKRYDDEIICNDQNIFETIKGWAMPEVRKIMDLPNSFYNDYLDIFGKLYPTLPKQIIHRDPNPSNIILKDGELAGFIDFELSERNIRLFDPCYASTAILSESFAENDDEKLQKWLLIFKNIIAGYDSVCKLSKEEKLAIPYVIYSIQMICVAYFGSVDKYAELAKISRKMLTCLYDNREKLIF